jgi:hypothetical protein
LLLPVGLPYRPLECFNIENDQPRLISQRTWPLSLVSVALSAIEVGAAREDDPQSSAGPPVDRARPKEFGRFVR